MLLQPQSGFDLGQRLTDAFARVFAGGFPVAAVIGTDSPDLPLSFIEQAFAGLEAGRGDVAFGPVEDGGYYLAALEHPARNCSGRFPGPPERCWKRAGTVRLLPAAAAFLPPWHDIDEPSDLARPELHDEQTAHR